MRPRKTFIAAVCIFFIGQSLQAQWQPNGSSIYYNGGNVGIGTSTPAAPFHVEASNQPTGFASIFNKSVSVAQTYTFESVGGLSASMPGPFWRGFHLASPAITQNGALTYPRLSLYADVNSFADPTSRTWVMQAGNSSLPFDLAFGVNDIEIMHLKSDGKIGIGTKSPNDLLDVTSTSGNNGIRINNGNASTDYTALRFFQGGGEKGVVFTNGENMFINRLSTGNLILNASSGNVGIGTTDTKGYKLAVNGNAIFTRVVVKNYNNWPDYVFYNSYRLRPLSDLEQYINQYHHLPEVPSAEEVKKNGLDVGESQATFLKKIEELTLYVIELNKRIQELESKEKPIASKGK